MPLSRPSRLGAALTRSRRTPLATFAGCLVSTVLLAAVPAQAHEPFEITTDAKVFPDRLQLSVGMASRTASAACWGLGRKPDDFEQQDLDEFPQRFQACARGLFRITSGGAQLEPTSVRVRLSVEHDFEAMLTYPAPRPGPLRFEALHLSRLKDPTYGAVITAVAQHVFLGQELLRANAPTLEVDVPTGAPAEVPAKAPAHTPNFLEFLGLGFHHILSGYDHLIFLLGVLLGCRTLRRALLLVTGFTIGHSLTLALAALNLVTLPAALVEPLIAATLTFVGIETLVRGDKVTARLGTTVAFGMIHGFGFAGALRELGLGANGAPIAIPLASFNLGVELGQLLVGAPLLLFLLWLQHKPELATKVRSIAALAVACAGAYWLIERTLLGG